MALQPHFINTAKPRLPPPAPVISSPLTKLRKLIRETFRAFFCRIRGDVAGLLVRILVAVVQPFLCE